jgi:cell filamentation protein
MIDSLDPYVYPGTDVLRNLRDIRDPEILARFEAQSTFTRLTALSAGPATGKFDVSHLKAIHRYIFQDVFPWAGEFRTVNISKGGNSFGRADFIEPSLNSVLNKLAKESYLKGSDRSAFIERAAYFLGEINAVHPFREGNGRTQREFIRQLALAADFTVSWRTITRDQMIAASQSSFLKGDNRGLKELIEAGMK